MDQIKLEELAVAYPIRKIWSRFIKSGGFCVFEELLKILDSYEPGLDKERNWEDWAAEFLLDILEEEEGRR